MVPRTKNGDSRTLFFTPETMALAKRLKPGLAVGFVDRLNWAKSKLANGLDEPIDSI